MKIRIRRKNEKKGGGGEVKALPLAHRYTVVLVHLKLPREER